MFDNISLNKTFCLTNLSILSMSQKYVQLRHKSKLVEPLLDKRPNYKSAFKKFVLKIKFEPNRKYFEVFT